MKEMQKGYIALFRQFLDWEWFTDVNTCHFFQYCLLRANPKTKIWQGKKIKRGQFVTSLSTISEETGLTFMQIRTCIKKLESTGEITNETTNQNRVITIKNYNEYQNNNKRVTNVLTNEITNGNAGSYKENSKPITNEITNVLTTNNKYIVNSIDNISSSSSIEKKSLKISEEEEEILKTRAKQNGIKYFKPWLRKLLANGDYLPILEEERKKQEREKQRAEKKKQEEKLKQKTPEQIKQEQEETDKAMKKAREKILKGLRKRGEN